MQACIAINTRQLNQLSGLVVIGRGILFQGKFGIAARAKDDVLKQRRLRAKEVGSGVLGRERRTGNA